MEATPFRKTVGAVAIIEDHQSVKIMFVMGMLPDELIQVRIYFVRLGIRQSKQQEDAALTPVPDPDQALGCMWQAKPSKPVHDAASSISQAELTQGRT